MDWFTLVGVSLGILKGLLAAATKSKAPAEFIDAIQAAISAVQKVHGSPVTKTQISELMVDGQFGG